MTSIHDIFGPVEGMKVVEPNIRWSVFRDAPELALQLEQRLSAVADLSRRMETALPVQIQWRFGNWRPVSRPDRHVRAFYLDLPAMIPGAQGCLAIKGSEVWAENFGLLLERLQSMWSIFTWSLGGPERHILDDICMMDQLERFPVAEGKPPGVHPLSDAIEEADVSSAYQTAHLQRYGEFARVPIPLLVCKWPDDLRDRIYSMLAPLLSRKARQIVENELQGGMGTFVYYYPTIPIRVMHLQIPDASTASGGMSFGDRYRRLAEEVDVEAAVEGWMKTAARMVALGWLPADPASLGRGNCLMPQNLVLDGGIVDLDSLREIDTIKTQGELQFALQKSVRVLAQAIAWFFVGTSAGLSRFERMYSDVYAYVWAAQRELLAGEDLPPRVAEIFSQDSLASTLKGYFSRALELSQFRPGDQEREEYVRR